MESTSRGRNSNRDLENWNTSQQCIKETKQDFGDLFQGVGKLKNYQLKLQTDPKLKPEEQPMRRIPFNLREPLERETSKLVGHQIIEKVDGYSPQISPVHLIPKKNWEWRPAINVRSGNKAVLRETFPIPNIEKLLLQLNGNTVFSRLDFNMTFHQIQLHPDSREMTTFITHLGLFRYMQQMFGITYAPENFQKIMQMLFRDCKGVMKFFDDFIVYSKTRKEHDDNLLALLQVIRKNGLTNS
jgi:hypothetical protein